MAEKKTENIDLMRPTRTEIDMQETALRPKSLQEFIGQKKMKENLSIYIATARQRRQSLDHCFLIGPPGLGKTTLAQIIANELKTGFIQTTAPALEKPKDLVGLLTKLNERDVILIDEIHRLKPAIEELLYIAMEDYGIDMVIGQGASSRTLRLKLEPFTLVGATTKAGSVSSPLISRFSIPCQFSFYEQGDMEAIVRRSAGLLNIKIENDAASVLARAARGTPRIANRLLRRMRDFAQFSKESSITKDVVRSGLIRLELDELGLEKKDREILEIIIERYKGGPVGVENLAISIGESVETIEYFNEPFLIQAGLLQRTARGRMVTSLAYGHLGITPNADTDNSSLFD